MVSSLSSACTTNKTSDIGLLANVLNRYSPPSTVEMVRPVSSSSATAASAKSTQCLCRLACALAGSQITFTKPVYVHSVHMPNIGAQALYTLEFTASLHHINGGAIGCEDIALTLKTSLFITTNRRASQISFESAPMLSGSNRLHGEYSLNNIVQRFTKSMEVYNNTIWRQMNYPNRRRFFSRNKGIPVPWRVRQRRL